MSNDETFLHPMRQRILHQSERRTFIYMPALFRRFFSTGEMVYAAVLIEVHVNKQINMVFTRSSKHRANIELARAGLLEPRPLAQM